jgi:hypothetical protein
LLLLLRFCFRVFRFPPVWHIEDDWIIFASIASGIIEIAFFTVLASALQAAAFNNGFAFAVAQLIMEFI